MIENKEVGRGVSINAEGVAISKAIGTSTEYTPKPSVVFSVKQGLGEGMVFKFHNYAMGGIKEAIATEFQKEERFNKFIPSSFKLSYKNNKLKRKSKKRK